MRSALALLAVIGCTPGLAQAIDRAHDEVRGQYLRVMKQSVDPNVEYLGDGCYIVGDRLGHGLGYGCVTDATSATGRRCIQTAGEGMGVFLRTCRRRIDLISGADCVDAHAPTHCYWRIVHHDRRHGRGTCTVRIRASGAVAADLPLQLDARAMLELKHALGKRWSGVGPLVWAAQSCGFPPRVGKRYTPSQALDQLIAAALAGQPKRCGITTVHVTGFENCVF